MYNYLNYGCYACFIIIMHIDDKMETDMPLHQSDVAVAPASFQPGCMHATPKISSKQNGQHKTVVKSSILTV